MSFNIEDDARRFKDIVRGKVKSNLKQFVSSGKILGQQGKKTINVPINTIDLPRFTYGTNSGGASQGTGNEGDPIDGQDQEKGSGKAGNDPGEHAYEAEFTPYELAQILGEELELPDIEDKDKGKLKSSSNRYTDIRRVGSESLRSYKRTFKQALKRMVSSGEYNPSEPKIIPIKDDKRYRASKEVETPETNAAIIFVQDVSGSMGEREKHIVRSQVFWVSLWLDYQYKGIETRFIVHDTTAKEVNREDFFTLSESGGTCISSAYKLALEMLQADYPVDSWNSYVLANSDGDNYSYDDNALAVSILKNGILPNCNHFFYSQIDGGSGSGEFINALAPNFSTNDNISLSRISSEDEILSSIQTLLGKRL